MRKASLRGFSEANFTPLFKYGRYNMLIKLPIYL